MAARGRDGFSVPGFSVPAPEPSLVRVCDLAGRPRGTGFAADEHGTVVTSHEAVDGLARIVLHAPDDRTCVVPAEAVAELPGTDLALVRTEGLGLRPLPFAARASVATGAYVRIAAGGWREARVLGTSAVTYTATDRCHAVGAALELAIGTDGADALRLGGGAAGGPVVDAATGAVLAVLGTALRPRRSSEPLVQDAGGPAGFAVRSSEPSAPDAEGPAGFAVRSSEPSVRDAEGPGGFAVWSSESSVGDAEGPGGFAVWSSEPSVRDAEGPGGFAVRSSQPSAQDAHGPAGSAVWSFEPSAQDTHRPAGFAVPLLAAAAADPGGPLAELVARNAATVPAYGEDLNLAGALHLTATSAGSDGPPAPLHEPVERPDSAREFAAFLTGPARVLGLVGDPGTGRTTELAALAARRARGTEPAPTLWLRGADLRGTDVSVADAVERALDRAGRILTASAEDGQGLGDHSADRVARLVHAAGRPLLLLLDGPEEMPAVLAHRLAQWSSGTARWLGDTGARLVVACRAEYWEQAGAHFDAASLHAAADGAELPGCVRLGDLPEPQASRARALHGIPDDALAAADARHPLALRLLGEVRGATPSAPPPGTPTREDVFSAYLHLLCLRVAVRLAAANGLRGSAVRRLAARVSGQVHEAARRCLGPGHGELDRAFFEEAFPWGARLHGCTGWASAVLTEGLLVPAGPGYRFAHEEVADWLQGTHLDVDGALEALVHRYRGAGGSPAVAGAVAVAGASVDRADAAAVGLEVPVGPGVQGGSGASVKSVGLEVPGGPGVSVGSAGSGGPSASEWPGGPAVPAGGDADGDADGDAVVPEQRRRRAGAARAATSGPATARDSAPASAPAPAAVSGPSSTPTPVPLLPVPRHRIGPVVQALLLLGRQRGAAELASRLGELTDALVEFGSDGGAAGGAGDGAWWASHLLGEVLLRVPDATPYLAVLEPLAARGEFGTAFWLGLPLAEADRFSLLRRLVVHDGPPGTPDRRLDAVAVLLRADPAGVQPLLARWFGDERPLDAAPDATVASAAQALLHTHRHRAIDDLTEALVDCAHARADELLAALAEEEPAALCRAVDRWARDERPGRRVAAAAYGLRAAPHTTTAAERALLRCSALALLARAADDALHGAALALLVRDPSTRAQYLPDALRRFTAGDPRLPASALAAALTTHPEPVLDAFRTRLHAPDPAADAILCCLADVTTPALARRVATLVHDLLETRPEAAAPAVAYIDRRLEHGPDVRPVLFPLVAGLLHSRHVQVRAALAPVLAAPGTAVSRALRGELLDVLLSQERDAAVLESVLRAVVLGVSECGEERARERVHRTVLLLVRTPEGASRCDRLLVELARGRPGFAALVTGWLADAPQDWAALVGPSALRVIENLAGGVRVPA
ncbi:serine protease [Streptomyces venezuelae]|uniref:serine protease n=1 Tax=Streptomyces venezuelae TaxID=54571 RepID=UPI0034571F5B